MRVVTDHKPRDVIDAGELTARERAEFDYLDWPAIDAGRDSASFFRYRGQVYDLGCFERGNPVAGETSLPRSLTRWDGVAPDSYFSGTVVRIVENGERVIVGRVYT